MTPTIALLTDFGQRDPYVAAMKAVISARCEARIVDLGHDIAPGDVFEAAVFLAAVAPYIGAETIVVAVIDPGVGTDRAIVAGEKNGVVFIAPDNGLLSLMPLENVRVVENDEMFLPHGSTTFHGRDRFAPVAAALATGARLEEVGQELPSIVRLDYRPASYRDDSASGSVISIDRFGNVVTDLDALHLPLERRVRLEIGGASVERVAHNYQEFHDGPFLIVGSRGTLEISVSNRSAADLLQARRLDRVEITWS